MEKIKQTFGSIRALKDNVEETRTIEFVISTSDKDRHGTVLNQANWDLENFNKNGIVGYQHNVYGGDMCNAPNPDDVLGVGKAWIEGDQLIGSVTFESAEINPLAEKIFRKILHGTLKATSVGFKPLQDENGVYGQNGRMENGKLVDKDTFYYFGQELLEFSIVNIPSNASALKRSMSDQVANAIMYVKRALGGNVRFSEIENMTVRDIINQLEGENRELPEKEEEVNTDATTDEDIRYEYLLKINENSLAL